MSWLASSASVASSPQPIRVKTGGNTPTGTTIVPNQQAEQSVVSAENLAGGLTGYCAGLLQGVDLLQEAEEYLKRIVDCGHFAQSYCDLYCRKQKEHSYGTCMNGFLFWSGCLSQAKEKCDKWKSSP